MPALSIEADGFAATDDESLGALPFGFAGELLLLLLELSVEGGWSASLIVRERQRGEEKQSA